MSKAKLEYEGRVYPIRLHKEWRESVKYSLGSKYLTIRVPKFIPNFMTEYHIEEAKNWAITQVQKRSENSEKVIKREYVDKGIFTIRDQDFILHIKEEKRKSFSGKIQKGKILIKAPQGHAGDRESLAKLMSRLMAAHFHDNFTNAVHHINNLHFQEEINKIRLKNNRSNWGSCSSDRNLNFSTRLLFAPFDVIKYVIVHELAHLKEMNHSPAYWAIVEKVMPDYKEKEKWLSDYNHLCHF